MTYSWIPCPIEVPPARRREVRKMKLLNTKMVLVSLLTILALIQSAAMADEAKPKYKKVSGQIMSATPTGIVIKGARSKQPLTLTVNAGTEIIGAKSVKAGDKAAVNYRADKNGNTATRIKVTVQAEKPESNAPSHAAANTQKPN
jgi:hypothetical protein